MAAHLGKWEDKVVRPMTRLPPPPTWVGSTGSTMRSGGMQENISVRETVTMNEYCEMCEAPRGGAGVCGAGGGGGEASTAPPRGRAGLAGRGRGEGEGGAPASASSSRAAGGGAPAADPPAQRCCVLYSF